MKGWLEAAKIAGVAVVAYSIFMIVYVASAEGEKRQAAREFHPEKGKHYKMVVVEGMQCVKYGHGLSCNWAEWQSDQQPASAR